MPVIDIARSALRCGTTIAAALTEVSSGGFDGRGGSGSVADGEDGGVGGTEG
jgi:hypothetical protein